jgi:cellulose synthase/poly-beta-1,6-N-acetylglucosamine synthase-like glycosyltransferase
MGVEADEDMARGLFNVSLQTAWNRRPSVTVGVPAYNERGRIGCLLRQILNQKDVVLKSVIFNVSGSTDGTDDEITSTAKNCGASSLVKIIDSHVRAGKAAALNDILRACNSEFVIFIDGDVRLGGNCLRNILTPFFQVPSVGVVSGNVMSLNDDEGMFSVISQLERQLHHEFCLYLTRTNQAPKVNGTFFAIRKGAVSCLPSETVSDDEYISYYAQKKGYCVVYVPEAVVYTKDPASFQDYMAKRRRIFGGHFLIRATTGYTVPTTRFSQIAPRLLGYSIRHREKVFYTSIMLLLQLLAYVLALSDVAAGNIPYRY